MILFCVSFIPVFIQILDCHIKGTRYNIKVAGNGLLNAGDSGTQLTWMDARIGDWVVTPRCGQPVEVQALWYNALCVMEDLAARCGDQEGQKKYSGPGRAGQHEIQPDFLEPQRSVSL